MARKPRTPKVPAATSSNKLLEALQFLSLITKDKGASNETHIMLSNQTAVAYNGVMAAGVRIEEAILASPHNTTMMQALSKCGQNLSVTQLENHRISIKSDKFKAIVPCLDPTLLQPGTPDPWQVEIDDRLKNAFQAASIFSVENSEYIYDVSVLLNGPSIITTLLGRVVLEYWHGLNMPPNVPIPKTFANIISKVNKKFARFGMSQFSITVYFHDDSWIKTHLYAEEWPDLSQTLEGPSNPYPLPPSFWEGVGAVSPFSPDGLVYFDQGVIRSHQDTNAGASFELDGLPRGPILNAKQLLIVKPYLETVDWFARTGDGRPGTKFFGKQCRGMIAGRITTGNTIERRQLSNEERNELDKNIPF